MHFSVYNSYFQLHHLKYTVSSPQTGFPTNIRYDKFNYTIWSTSSAVLLENPCILVFITVIFNYTIWSMYTISSLQPGFPTKIRYDKFNYTIWSTLSHGLLENPCILVFVTVILNYTIWSTPSQVSRKDSLLILDMICSTTPYEVHHLMSSLRIHAFWCI